MRCNSKGPNMLCYGNIEVMYGRNILFHLQTSTSVKQRRTTVMTMRHALIQMEVSSVPATQAILEMVSDAQVRCTPFSTKKSCHVRI